MIIRVPPRHLRHAALTLLLIGCGLPFGCSQGGRGSAAKVKTISAPVASGDMCDLGVDGSLFTRETPIRVVGGTLPALQSIAAIGVARVHCDGGASERALQIESIAPERGALWNQVLSNLSGVREVVPIQTLGLDPRGVGPKEILQAAREQECNYCLIFQIDDFMPSTAAIRAVLWSVDDGAALVAFNSSAQLSQAVIEQVSDDDKYAHRREADASYQVEAELRRMVHDTIWDMAARTAPDQGPTSRPNPWKTDQPILPRDDHRYRRYFLRSGE